MGNANHVAEQQGTTSLGDSTTTGIRNCSTNSLSYFYSEISRNQAEDIMRRHAMFPGSYLVRLSSRHQGYAITVVVDYNLLGHVLVCSPHERCYYTEVETQFESLASLVHHYKTHPLPVLSSIEKEVLLKFPVHRFRPQHPYPYQEREPLMYDLAREKIYCSIEENNKQQKTIDPSKVTFYEDGRRVVLLEPPPCPNKSRSSGTLEVRPGHQQSGPIYMDACVPSTYPKAPTDRRSVHSYPGRSSSGISFHISVDDCTGVDSSHHEGNSNYLQPTKFIINNNNPNCATLPRSSNAVGYLPMKPLIKSAYSHW